MYEELPESLLCSAPKLSDAVRVLFPYRQSPELKGLIFCPKYFPTWDKYCCTSYKFEPLNCNGILPHWKLFWLLVQYMVQIEVYPWRQEEIGSNGSDSNCGCVL